MKNRFIFFLLSGFLNTALAAQGQTTPTEVQAVQHTVTTFFDGMRRGDSTLVRSTLAPGAVFHAITTKPSQDTKLESDNVNDFLRALATPQPLAWDERVQFERVLIDANLASVWAPYEFYLGSTFSHCGYDSFQLVKLAGGWKIAHIIDTRRKEKCR